MSRLGYFARRVVITVVLIFAVASLLFFVSRALPGDYATTIMAGSQSTQGAEALRAKWGLDQPLYVQYFQYITNLMTGDAGLSRATGEPVLDTVSAAFWNTAVIAIPALILAFVVGTVYGALMGNNPGSRLEKYGIVPPTVFGTTPDFFLGILLLVVFWGWLGWLPSGGLASLETYRATDSRWQLFMTKDFLLHASLPFLTITLKYLYYPALIMRGSVVEVRGQEFAVYQRLLGLNDWTRFKHIMKHASLPVITILPALTATSLSAQVLIEIVFNWPGLGKLLLDSVLQRDTPVLQFLFLVIAAWIIIGNFVVDIVYTLIDPRISYEGE